MSSTHTVRVSVDACIFKRRSQRFWRIGNVGCSKSRERLKPRSGEASAPKLTHAHDSQRHLGVELVDSALLCLEGTQEVCLPRFLYCLTRCLKIGSRALNWRGASKTVRPFFEISMCSRTCGSCLPRKGALVDGTIKTVCRIILLLST